MSVNTVDFNSPYYPYVKVDTGALTMRGVEEIPYKILLYLLDLPDANGYQPVDDNSRPRVRLAKYIWYDEAFPLENPLPTPKEKRSMLFDPREPVLDTDAEKAEHPKGYRLQWQRIRGQSQLEAKTLLKCYIGRMFERRKYISTIGIRFEIWVNTDLETNTRTSAYQRSMDIEQCLHDALDGVDIAGIGTVSFAMGDHGDNGSDPLWDEVTNVGRSVNCSITWAEGPENSTVNTWGGEC